MSPHTRSPLPSTFISNNKKLKLLTLLCLSSLLLAPTPTAAAPRHFKPGPSDLEIPGGEDGIDLETGLLVLPARPPFSLHDYSGPLTGRHSWSVPNDERKSLMASLHGSYERMRTTFCEKENVYVEVDNPDYDESIEEDKNPRDRLPTTILQASGTKPVGDMPSKAVRDWVYYIMNPDNQELTDEEVEYIDKEILRFKTEQGILEDEKGLQIGFLSRGASLRFITNLFMDLRDGRRHNSVDLGHSGDVVAGRRRLLTPKEEEGGFRVDAAGKKSKKVRIIKAKDMTFDGLWQHEIDVDERVGRLAKEFRNFGRKSLERM